MIFISFEEKDISDVMARAPSLCPSDVDMTEFMLDDPNKTILSLFDFLAKQPGTMQMHQKVVVILDYYFTLIDNGNKAFLKLFVASR